MRNSDAAPIVGYLHQHRTTTHKLDLDGSRAAVHGVFQQFLESSGGPFDHLAGSDLINQMIGQGLDLSWFGDTWNSLKCPNWRGLWQNRERKTQVARRGDV